MVFFVDKNQKEMCIIANNHLSLHKTDNSQSEQFKHKWIRMAIKLLLL